jgi:3-deoxy-D-manno-octulosonate 8-phosphate phosphatase (KDO 8-P phosphatase)
MHGFLEPLRKFHKFNDNKIKYVFLDVDGVLTNGKKIYDKEHKAVYKEFNDKDFTAIDLIRSMGIEVILLTGDGNINKQMAESRNIPIIVTKQWLEVKTFDIDNCEKLNIIKEHCEYLDEVCYVGDDYFDIPIIMNVGMGCCPNDAPYYVKNNCVHVMKTKGGEGVVAELLEMLLS